MKHVAFMQDSTCLIIIIIQTIAVIGSVVTQCRMNAKDASSRLGQSKGPFALPKNCLQCVCTYIYNR